MTNFKTNNRRLIFMNQVDHNHPFIHVPQVVQFPMITYLSYIVRVVDQVVTWVTFPPPFTIVLLIIKSLTEIVDIITTYSHLEIRVLSTYLRGVLQRTPKGLFGIYGKEPLRFFQRTLFPKNPSEAPDVDLMHIRICYLFAVIFHETLRMVGISSIMCVLHIILMMVLII